MYKLIVDQCAARLPYYSNLVIRIQTAAILLYVVVNSSLEKSWTHMVQSAGLL